MAFSTDLDGQELIFGVSGLLYNSDVLLYDRGSESLWSQLMMQAISGPMKGQRLQALPISHTSWEDWSQRHPDTLVLSTDTGFSRDYRKDPYAGYSQSKGLYFPVAARSRQYHPKERVLGVEIDGAFKAYPFAELSRLEGGRVTDTLNGEPITVRFNAKALSAQAYDSQGAPLPATTSFWFAWYAFHPDTKVFQYQP